MKNLLNRLTRFMIIMLLLVDRTPFFNVYAAVVTVPDFRLLIDTNGDYNAGQGYGGYEYDIQDLTNVTGMYWDYSFQVGDSGQLIEDFVYNNYGVSPQDLTAYGYEFITFTVLNITIKKGVVEFASIGASFKQLPIPTANPDNFTINEDNSISFTEAQLMANDTVTGDLTLDVTSFTNPANGTLVHDGASTFTYTPNANYSGTVTFSYTLNGMTAVPSATTTVSITVNPVNDAPIAVANSYSTAEDTVLVVSAPGVIGNDTDVENNPLTAILVSGTSNGTLALNPNGSFTYTPTANFNGSQ